VFIYSSYFVDYSDKVFIIISQIEKFGTFIQATADSSSYSTKKLYVLKTLMGKRDDDLLNMYARQLIEQVNTISEKPLLLAIALHDSGRDQETFAIVLQTTMDLLRS
jgi:proteasome assembly chaperone 3